MRRQTVWKVLVLLSFCTFFNLILRESPPPPPDDSLPYRVVYDPSEQNINQTEIKFGCVIYLMTSDKYVDGIRSSIIYLDHFFNRKEVKVVNGEVRKPYDYVIFHTPNSIKEEHKQILRDAAGSNVIFVRWELNFPKRIQDMLDKDGLYRNVWLKDMARTKKWLISKGLKASTCGHGFDWEVTYLMMNRFFSYQMYLQPILKNYKYYLRLDADSFPAGPWVEDPFIEMEKKNATFLWRDVHKEVIDPEGCVVGMKNHTLTYFRRLYESGELPVDEFWNDQDRGEVDPPAQFKLMKVMEEMPEGYKWEGNIGAGRLAFFRSANYLAFAKWMNEEHMGIYAHRWGDQDLYPLGVLGYGKKVVKGWGAQIPLTHKEFPKCEDKQCKLAERRPGSRWWW
eukprot:TRINITY_DN2547_c0_g1_i1.p1 TRINITY_DN2547_c0_g1~~TRINITY_DN2547_c0_g1_i1.p1  ORF type:complete len:405 (-),score=67.31 TRINITY_DN2547_c0_g1_i1:121-1305(-)